MGIAVAKITVNPEKADIQPFGGVRAGLFSLTFSGNYVSGGEVVAPTFETLFKQLGAGEIYFVQIQNATGGYVHQYDYVNKKVLTLFGDNNNAADGPLIEIPVAAYPAGVTATPARALVIGR